MKRSAIAEAAAGSGAPSVGEGWEQGTRGRELLADDEAPAIRGPETPTVLATPGLDGAATAALALRWILPAALGVPADWVTLRVSTADISEGRSTGPRSLQPRRISTAQVMIGPDARWPLWSRVTLLAGTATHWSPAWLAAAQRVLVEVTRGLPRAEIDPASLDGVIVVDAFAAADLLRLAANAWGRRPPASGEQVAAEGVHISAAPVFPLRTSAVGASEESAPNSTDLVQAGRWMPTEQFPRDGDQLPSSWRDESSGLAAASLCLEALPERGPDGWPEDALVITGLVPLRSTVLARGHVRRGGHPSAGWGPAPLPDPDWWLTRIRAAVSSPIDDATGVPVRVPAVVLKP